jgi:asparagine synthase (glutamine-hydrolysing)
LSSNLLSGLKPSTIQKIYKSGEIFIPKKYRVSNFSDKSTKLSMVLSSKSIEDFYNRITSNIHIYGDIMLNNNKEDYYSSKLNHSDFGYMLENDFNTYLPDDILVKVDRASMANSLEVRAPFLDHEVIEFAFDMNFNEKINFSENKIPLRKLLKKYLPENMISKNKRGFGIPLNRWLKEDLREWAEELISVKNIKEHDFFDYEKVKEVWNSHLSGKKENQNIIWPLLMFQSWLLKEKI